MGNHRSLALGVFAGFIADAAQQAVTHLMHDCRCAAGFFLVPAGAEINACAADQSVSAAGDVRIKPLEFVGDEGDAPQAHFIGLGHGVRQQFLDFIAERKGLFQWLFHVVIL